MPIPSLPVVTINTPLERVRADLYAHLSTLAKIDNLKIRHGKLLRGHPHGARQLLAFAYFSVGLEFGLHWKASKALFDVTHFACITDRRRSEKASL